MSLNVIDTFEKLVELPTSERDFELASIRTLSPKMAESLRKMLFVYESSGQKTNVSLPYDQLGVWRLRDRIASGGSGNIYLVTRNDDVHQETAALKLVRQTEKDDNNVFALERRRLAKLNHPYIARLIDGGKAPDNALFMVVEYLKGSDPVEYCERHNLSVRERLKLFLRMCDAVSYLHSFGLIHRDIKPENMIVAEDGTLKLLDFGISAEHGDPDSKEAGTPAYAAPEVWQNAVPSITQDIYSLGLILYSLCCGKKLGRNQSNLGLLTKIMFAEPSLTPDMLSSFPKEITVVIKRACETNPNQRYSSVLALRQDIEALLDKRPLKSYGGISYVLQCFLRRNPWASALAFTVAGLVGFSLMLGQRAMIERDQLSRSEQRMTITQHYLSQVFRNSLSDGHYLSADTALANTIADVFQQLPQDTDRLLPVLVEMGRLYQEMNKPQQAVDVFELGQPFVDKASDYQQAWFYFGYAEALNGVNRDKDAILALVVAESFFSHHHQEYNYEFFRVKKLKSHLTVVKPAKDAHGRAKAIAALSALITEAENHYPNDTGTLANLYGSLAKAYILNEQWEAGEKYANHTLLLMQRNGLGRSSVYFATHILLAYVMNVTDRPADAMRLLEQVVSARRESLGPSLYGAAEINGLINLKLDAGDVREAQRLAEMAMSDLQQLGLDEHQVAFGLEVQLCEINVMLGRSTIRCFAELFEKATAAHLESESKLKTVLQSEYLFFKSRQDEDTVALILEKARNHVSDSFAERLASF